MIRAKLLDGSLLEIDREEALELLPFRGVFASPLLKSPLEGVLLHRGQLLPVLGPLPRSPDATHSSADEQAWVLLLKGCAQVILGLPEFIETAGESDVPDGIFEQLDSIINEAA